MTYVQYTFIKQFLIYFGNNYRSIATSIFLYDKPRLCTRVRENTQKSRYSDGIFKISDEVSGLSTIDQLHFIFQLFLPFLFPVRLPVFL